MDLHLRDRIYVVTGGSRGLGFAAADALIAEGARVLVSSHGKGSAAAAADRLADNAAAADHRFLFRGLAGGSATELALRSGFGRRAG